MSSVFLLASAGGDVVLTDHLRSQLVAESTAAVAGQSLRLGLLFEHEPLWHTYWVNPGDSGLPTRLRLTLPDGVSAQDVQWPAPQRFDLGDIVNYGYEGRILLPVNLLLPAELAGPSLSIELQARWLVCQEECIPGQASYRLQLPLASRAEADPRWQADFQRATQAQPKAVDWSATLSEQGDAVQLALHGNLPPQLAKARWFPHTPRLVANSALPTWQATVQGGHWRWRKSEFFSALPGQSEWWLRLGDETYRFVARSEPTTDHAEGTGK
nr:protein-disulfide reductase DsbD domain-containing protein [Pseudomarimonas arenosa]